MTKTLLHDVSFITVAVTAVTYLSRLLNSLLNHKATENAKMLADKLEQGFTNQTVALTHVIVKGNSDMVAAIRESKL